MIKAPKKPSSKESEEVPGLNALESQELHYAKDGDEKRYPSKPLGAKEGQEKKDRLNTTGRLLKGGGGGNF